ncbi:UNVERIFIED_CONTAM: hypothetical protein Sindi_1586300 [Sesamum indicum]
MARPNYWTAYSSFRPDHSALYQEELQSGPPGKPSIPFMGARKMVQFDPNTWILEYKQRFLLENSRLVSSVLEFLKLG